MGFVEQEIKPYEISDDAEYSEQRGEDPLDEEVEGHLAHRDVENLKQFLSVHFSDRDLNIEIIVYIVYTLREHDKKSLHKLNTFGWG